MENKEVSSSTGIGNVQTLVNIIYKIAMTVLSLGVVSFLLIVIVMGCKLVINIENTIEKNVVPYVFVAKEAKTQTQIELKLLNIENRLRYLERTIIRKKHK